LAFHYDFSFFFPFFPFQDLATLDDSASIDANNVGDFLKDSDGSITSVNVEESYDDLDEDEVVFLIASLLLELRKTLKKISKVFH
jgi:hypothetical protein